MGIPEFPGVRLVGNHFRPAEAKEFFSAISVGDILPLEREPENPHDANAIKVNAPFGLHLAYVERQQAAWISGWLDQGAEMVAEVTYIEPWKGSTLVEATIRVA